MPSQKLPPILAFAAALLFTLGVLTGGLIPVAKVMSWDSGSVLAAHLNGLSGAFWLLGVAWSLRFARLSDRAGKVLLCALLVATYANWSVTLLKAILGVKGIAWLGEPSNDLIFVLLNVFVVLPTLGGAALWTWSLRPGARHRAEPSGSG